MQIQEDLVNFRKAIDQAHPATTFAGLQIQSGIFNSAHVRLPPDRHQKGPAIDEDGVIPQRSSGMEQHALRCHGAFLAKRVQWLSRLWT